MDAEDLTTNDFTDNFKILSQHDFSDPDDNWIDASFLVTTNRERHDIIGAQMPRLAFANNTHVITWSCDTAKWEQKPKEEFLMRALQDPALNEFFVAGTDGFVNVNLCKKKGIVNATRIKFHSILPIDDHQKNFLQQQISTQPVGTTIRLECPPLAILVELLDVSQTDHSSWMKLSLCPDRIIIPILQRKGKWSKPIPVPGDFDFPPSRVQVRTHFPLEQGVAVTIHKAQGRTIEKVILLLSERLQPKCNLTHPALFVGASRVETSLNVRLLINSHPNHPAIPDMESISHVANLRPQKEIKQFFSGFDEHGFWSAERALSQLQS